MSESAPEGKTRKRGTSNGATAGGATSSSQGEPAGGGFVCPECGKTFGRAQALGAHRSRTHGVPGVHRARASTRAKTRPAKAGTEGARGRSRAARGRSSTANSKARSAQGESGQFDRDQLLAVVFPNGVPAKVSVIEALAPWLAEGERLSQMR